MTLSLQTRPEQDDAILIGLCLDQADKEAYNTLVKRYLQLVYNYILQWVKDYQLAEDLTQETFIRAYRALGKFDRNRPFKAWLFAIATNVCKTALKKNAQFPLLLDYQAHENNLLENVPDISLPDVEQVADEHTGHQMQQALNQLAPSVRQALILRHVYDLPYEQVAAIMDTKLNTVRTWLKRGRESLIKILDKPGGLLDE